MQFDILVTVRHLVSNSSISGYLTKEPLIGEDATPENVQQIVDTLQESFGKGGMSYITLFTRDALPLFSGTSMTMTTRECTEITIPKQILDGSVLAFQIA